MGCIQSRENRLTAQYLALDFSENKDAMDHGSSAAALDSPGQGTWNIQASEMTPENDSGKIEVKPILDAYEKVNPALQPRKQLPTIFPTDRGRPTGAISESLMPWSSSVHWRFHAQEPARRRGAKFHA